MKKILKFLSFMVVSSFIFPNVISAGYYRLNEFKSGETDLVQSYTCGPNNQICTSNYAAYQYTESGQPVEGTAIYYLTSEYSSANGTKPFSLKIKGTELDAEKSYTLSISSSIANVAQVTNNYTGSELNTGVTVSITPTTGTATLTLSETESGNLVDFHKMMCDSAADPSSCQSEEFESYSTILILFSYPSSQSGPTYPEPTEEELAALEVVAQQIIGNGVISLNTVEPNGPEEAEAMISAALENQYHVDGYILFGTKYDDGTEVLSVQATSNPRINNQYEVTYSYLEKNLLISAKVDALATHFNMTWNDILSDYDKRFVVEDLESINYLYNTAKIEDNDEILNNLVNYSSKLHRLADNVNVDFIFIPGAGGTESDFYKMNVGPMNILYDGMVYKTVDPVGFSLTQVLYIPDNTSKSRAAYIEAAKRRINEYLKGVDIEITYAGDISDLNEAQYSWEKVTQNGTTYVRLFDLDKTNGEWYNIRIGSKIYKYFIVADSSKMNVPFVKTIDPNTNVYITTDSFDAPLDSRLNVNKLDKNSDEYKALEKKLDIIKGLAFDLNLYSTSLDMYVTKLADGSFKVYIPVDEETAKMNLVAVYVKDDGTLEEHPITIENGYAVFETNHFSTYSIVESFDNPATGDTIARYIIIGVVSVVGLAGLGIYVKRNKKNK